MELKFLGFDTNEYASACSNRTFMELKYCCLGECVQTHASSNRTFMELKFDQKNAKEDDKGVLIVPLWN